MVNRPSVPEIITVNSEELQAQIRDLLPSQNGFGSELQATNVITPIIDLTSTAEGSGLPISLQQAIAFGSQTAFNIANTTTTIANSPGFYRIFGVANVRNGSSPSADRTAQFDMTDGLSTKTIWELALTTNSDIEYQSLEFDFIVWLASGESIAGVSDSTVASLNGSVRQVADSTGTLVNPSGYPL